MNPQQVTKDLITLLVGAGLKKDVIDLFKEKNALLTDKIAILEKESSDLKTKIQKLEQELERLRPKADGLEDEQKKILKLLFDRDRHLSLEEIARSLGIIKGIVQHHFDVLFGEGMIGPGPLGTCGLSSEGRAYVVKYLLKK